MSIYGKILFARKHNKVLKEMKKQDSIHFWDIGIDSQIEDIKYDVAVYDRAKKSSRKVCRLRDIFWDLAFNTYHTGTDDTEAPDRVQMYHFGKMEVFT